MVAATLIGFNALASFVIWALGVGVPKTGHILMGFWFLALNVSPAIQYLREPEPKPVRLVVSLIAVVPVVALSVVAAALIL